jgi:hypothetical protein
MKVIVEAVIMALFVHMVGIVFHICGILRGYHCCQMVDYYMRVWPDKAINGQPLSTGIQIECKNENMIFSGITNAYRWEFL